jgi:hypothetical protein
MKDAAIDIAATESERYDVAGGGASPPNAGSNDITSSASAQSAKVLLPTSQAI